MLLEDKANIFSEILARLNEIRDNTLVVNNLNVCIQKYLEEKV